MLNIVGREQALPIDGSPKSLAPPVVPRPAGHFLHAGSSHRARQPSIPLDSKLRRTI